MVKAVRLSEYGDVNVLTVEEVDQPAPAAGQVLVRVKAAGINPGEATIRRGLLHERWPSTFPSGQGSDLAGVVTEVGPEVSTVDVGDEVIGFTHQRASHAEFVLVEAENLTPRPSAVSWGRRPARFSSPERPRMRRWPPSRLTQATRWQYRERPAESAAWWSNWPRTPARR